MTEGVTGRLEGWWYNAGWRVFEGYIFGDVRGRFSDGQYIHTSHCPIPDAKEGDVVKTLNSSYLLGKPLERINDSE